MRNILKRSLKRVLPSDSYRNLSEKWNTRLLPVIHNRAHLTKVRWSQPSLQEIGRYHGTDKAAASHSFNGKSFLEVYDSYVSVFRRRTANVLEIGVLNGASLRSWRDYGARWNLFGIDINPEAKLAIGPRIAIEIGSQDDTAFLRSCFGREKRFDVVVDDGSHVNPFTIASFNTLFHERLNYGGIYIIEDLGCSYSHLYNVLSTWPGMHLNDPSKDYSNPREMRAEFFESLISELDHLRGEVEFVHFWSRICVIGKVASPPHAGS